GDKLSIAVKRGDETLRSDVTLVGELTPFEAGFLGVLPTREKIGSPAGEGVGIRWVYPDSPAAKIGLKPRDRIIKFRDQAVTSAAQLADLVSRVRPTEKATLVVRRDGNEESLEAVLGPFIDQIPSDLPSAAIESVPSDDKLKSKEADDGKLKDAGGEPKTAEDKGRLRTGRFTEQIEESKNSYWAFVPEDYNPAYAYALVVWLHAPGDTQEAAVYDLWKTSCQQRGIILLGPKAANLGTGWQANEAEFVHETVVTFQKKYSIDASRIVLHGFANSGPFATHLAFKHRDLFRGLALAAAPILERPPENLPEYRLQFHLVCGAKDRVHTFVEKNASALRTLKYPTSLTSLPDLEHRYPNADGVDAMARWIDSL
ncbi:MAG TPA: PDZ domain-containing protein, partial [Planctomycetaceae bacterium]|nr:PDZ domain-containing protein [Planctomycetaceae bacterium]